MSVMTMQDRIMTYLRSCSEPQTFMQICYALQAKKISVGSMIRRLRRFGEVDVVEDRKLAPNGVNLYIAITDKKRIVELREKWDKEHPDAKLTKEMSKKRIAAMKSTAQPNMVLVDMRHVWSKPASEDKTERQRILRELFEKDKLEFLDRMERAEKELTQHRLRMTELNHKHYQELLKQERAAQVEDEPDEGEQAALELLTSLLKSKAWEKKK